MNTEEVATLLRERLRVAGSAAEFARRVNGAVAPSVISMFLHGCIKNPPTGVLVALGLRKVTSYEKIAEDQQQRQQN